MMKGLFVKNAGIEMGRRHPDVEIVDGKPTHTRNCQYYNGRGTYANGGAGLWHCQCGDQKTDLEIDLRVKKADVSHLF